MKKCGCDRKPHLN